MFVAVPRGMTPTVVADNRCASLCCHQHLQGLVIFHQHCMLYLKQEILRLDPRTFTVQSLLTFSIPNPILGALMDKARNNLGIVLSSLPQLTSPLMRNTRLSNIRNSNGLRETSV
ncbi:hypothetical protein ABKN59_008865 [Abortiporus biennis]